MPIFITGSSSIEKFRRFPEFASGLMSDAVGDGVDYGQRRMRELVPHGATGRLSAAVGSSGPTLLAPGSYSGSVHVDPAIAPYAADVNAGTGVDGPFRAPVVIKRPSRTNPKRPGKMLFFKLGEGAGDGIFRSTVKIHPSSKIERGKNFLQKTYDSMVVWTGVRTIEIIADIAGYFARR